MTCEQCSNNVGCPLKELLDTCHLTNSSVPETLSLVIKSKVYKRCQDGYAILESVRQGKFVYGETFPEWMAIQEAPIDESGEIPTIASIGTDMAINFFDNFRAAKAYPDAWLPIVDRIFAERLLFPISLTEEEDGQWNRRRQILNNELKGVFDEHKFDDKEVRAIGVLTRVLITKWVKFAKQHRQTP